MQVVLSPSDSPICYTLQMVVSVVVEISFWLPGDHMSWNEKWLRGRHRRTYFGHRTMGMLQQMNFVQRNLLKVHLQHTEGMPLPGR
jgi:hypothetical protein